MSPHMPTSGKEAQKPQDWNFLQAAPTPQVVTYPPKATPPTPVRVGTCLQQHCSGLSGLRT